MAAQQGPSLLMAKDFQSHLSLLAKQIEKQIDVLLPKSGLMAEPMRYAVLNGGKRLRGFLVLESANLFGITHDEALPASVAIECMHAYSLVHDDLPAMDDDDTRRGKPTVHKKWDEATAILVGDALQAEAFQILADMNAPIKLMGELAKASGARGMVLGQAQDIAAETAGDPLNLNQISILQSLKTGALIKWSATAGAEMAGADPSPLANYAEAIGKAFQIQDDILDVEGDEALAGKALQKDAIAGKATFVSLLGMNEAKKQARDLVESAINSLEPYGNKADQLRQCAHFVISRNM